MPYRSPNRDTTAMPSSDDQKMIQAKEALKKYYGYDSFRGGQATIIGHVLRGRDVIGVMPTGQGKSVCYQIPSMVLGGVTVVISPLLALMKDQVDGLEKIGYPAVAVTSQTPPAQLPAIYNALENGGIHLLFCSPERLQNTAFQAVIKKLPVRFIAVDEAHCISEWGYDFRPGYQQIADCLNEIFPDKRPPVLALTATATKAVVEDIRIYLALADPEFYIGGFERTNVSLSVFEVENKRAKLLQILRAVSGPAIVYAMNRELTEETARYLNSHHIPSLFYHAGLSDRDRAKIQDAFFRGESRVMCSTNAFGMGINKTDIRTVIHLEPSETLEAYYQEAGRAGRDGKKSYAVLLYDKSDLEKRQFLLAERYATKSQAEAFWRILSSLSTLQTEQRLPFGVRDGNVIVADAAEIKAFLTQQDPHGFPPATPIPIDRLLSFFHKLGWIYNHTSESENDTFHFLHRREYIDSFVRRYGSKEDLQVMEALLRQFGNKAFAETPHPFHLQRFSEKYGLSPNAVLKSIVHWQRQKIAAYHSHHQLVFEVNMGEAMNHKGSADTKKAFNDLEKRFRSMAEKNDAVAHYCRYVRCRRNFILDYFGETYYTEHCGICDNCLGRHRK